MSRQANKASKPNLANVPANTTVEEKAPSSVFNQPNVIGLMSTPVQEPAPVETPSNRKYATREAWGTAALHMILDLLGKDKMDGERIIRVAFKNLPDKRHVLVSANAPLAKRSKTGNEVKLVGRTAEVYPPSMSEDGTTWQIFLASQIDGDENYLNLLFGQVMRLANWDKEATNKRKLYTKETKEKLAQFGFIADEDIGALAVKDKDAAKEILALGADLGPSGFVRIDVEAKDAQPATANRGARLYCNDKACACHQTEAGKNKKNKTGGYFANTSDPWAKEYLALAKLDIPTSSTIKETVLTGLKCPFNAFGGDPEASLIITWSEYEINQRLTKETGKASEMR